MDPFSHGITGALLAQSAARPQSVRTAAAAGAIGAMLVDLDILIRSGNDPLLNLDFHRHFTHALVFIPVGGLLAALVLWPLLQRPHWHRGLLEPVAFARLYLFGTLGCATAGLLDAATSYGTHLLWPFSDARTAWSVISIIDPVYTLLGAAVLLYVLLKRQPAVAWVGVILLLAWPGLGWLQQSRASLALDAVVDARGHRVERRVVKPSFGNLLLWRGVYEYDGHFYVDAYRAGPFSAVRFYPGGVERVATPEVITNAVNARGTAHEALLRDIDRFAGFSDNYLTLQEMSDEPGCLVLGDIRFAMLPYRVDPLWGLVICPGAEPNVAFRNFRQFSSEDRDQFFSMLLGR